VKKQRRQKFVREAISMDHITSDRFEPIPIKNQNSFSATALVFQEKKPLRVGLVAARSTKSAKRGRPLEPWNSISFEWSKVSAKFWNTRSHAGLR
jgi:hypothetical protein